MAKMRIAGEELEMPVWLKGRLLAQTVEKTNDPDVFTCESGTSNKRYRIVTDGLHALSCSCPAVGSCAHRIAVEKYVSEQAGEMEAVAMAIIEQEKAAKEQAQEARKAAAIARANEYRRELEQSPWNWATINAKAVHPAVVEAERHLSEQRKIEAFSFMK